VQVGFWVGGGYTWGCAPVEWGVNVLLAQASARRAISEGCLVASITTSTGLKVFASNMQEARDKEQFLTPADFQRLVQAVILESSLQSTVFDPTLQMEGVLTPVDTIVADPIEFPTGIAPLVTAPQPGDDLRNVPGGGGGGGGSGGFPQLPVVVGVSSLVALLPALVRGPAITFIRGLAPPGARFAWNALPGWLRTALIAVGATAGLDMIMDLSGAGIGGGGDIEPFPHQVPHMVDGHLGAHIVGQWVANGVTFYRLSDGKLAVQNKRGRWKVWKPKKPIVIMPSGAVDLRTLLRADAVLNKQAKRLATMLNRRAPRPRRSKSMGNADSVIVMDGKVVTK